jgi:hypothetical protein
VAEITLKVPETWMQLPDAERERLIRAGLHEAARARIHQLQTEIAQAQQEVNRFEARYGMTLDRFEAEILPQQDTYPVHEDYNDWFYWQSVLDEKQQILTELQHIDLT